MTSSRLKALVQPQLLSSNNELNQPKLHKEQELIVNAVVKHCFLVTFTFCANFRLKLVKLQIRAEFHFIPILHTWTDRFAWKTFSECDIPILSPF